MSPEVAQPIGRYAVHGELASGGMASVYFARLLGPSGFTRTVALKRPHEQLAKEREFAMMFIDEARLAARIRHSNVVSTLDVIETPSGPALVMDYVHGESLSKLSSAARARGEGVPLPIAAAIVIDALHGLHAAHEATDENGQPLGIVHRDVSPPNILVGADGITRIADFGIAKAAGRLLTTRDGAIKGKYAYMAPEQIRGGSVSRLTDVYAATIVLWELLTGESLFRADTDAETICKCLEAAVPAPSTLIPGLPRVFDEIVRRGLSREPADRFPTARAMATELERAAPPVRPSEVGAWVERLAGDTLAARAATIAAMDRSGPVGYAEMMPTVASGKALVASADLSQTSQISHAGMVSESAVRASLGRQHTRRATWVVAPFALLCGLFGALLVARRSIAPVAPQPASAPFATPVLPSASALVDPTAPASVADASAPIGPGAGASAKPTPRPTPRGGRAKPAAACNPPYTIDSSGREVFKLECL